ncbi:inorganic triphosphatase, partial [Klebsiella pneumoniae]|nr:inorganic triphosphatase [Klebsiella pneumoniae]
ELELLAGETADLLRLALRWRESGVLRQGRRSRAARGEPLAHGNTERPVNRLAELPVPANASEEQALEAALESALAQRLYHDE